MNSLRRQAAKARRYRILREELRELLRRVYVAEERSLASLLDETRAQLEEATTEDRTLVEELTAREEDARRATQEARDIEEELDGCVPGCRSRVARDRRYASE